MDISVICFNHTECEWEDICERVPEKCAKLRSKLNDPQSVKGHGDTQEIEVSKLAEQVARLQYEMAAAAKRAELESLKEQMQKILQILDADSAT